MFGCNYIPNEPSENITAVFSHVITAQMLCHCMQTYIKVFRKLFSLIQNPSLSLVALTAYNDIQAPNVTTFKFSRPPDLDVFCTFCIVYLVSSSMTDGSVQNYLITQYKYIHDTIVCTMSSKWYADEIKGTMETAQCQRAYYTNNSFTTNQIPQAFNFALILILTEWSPQNFTHDMTAVSCVESCRDKISSNRLTANWDFHRIKITTKKSFVKWSPELHGKLMAHFFISVMVSKIS